jgi:hypothetical protein
MGVKCATCESILVGEQLLGYLQSRGVRVGGGISAVTEAATLARVTQA